MTLSDTRQRISRLPGRTWDVSPVSRHPGQGEAKQPQNLTLPAIVACQYASSVFLNRLFISIHPHQKFPTMKIPKFCNPKLEERVKNPNLSLCLLVFFLQTSDEVPLWKASVTLRACVCVFWTQVKWHLRKWCPSFFFDHPTPHLLRAMHQNQAIIGGVKPWTRIQHCVTHKRPLACKTAAHFLIEPLKSSSSLAHSQWEEPTWLLVPLIDPYQTPSKVGPFWTMKGNYSIGRKLAWVEGTEVAESTPAPKWKRSRSTCLCQ